MTVVQHALFFEILPFSLVPTEQRRSVKAVNACGKTSGPAVTRRSEPEVLLYRPMFECDSPGAQRECHLFLFVRSWSYLEASRLFEQCCGHPASGLAFGHSECDKESSASRRPSFTICHENR